jgi:hypothetical protein
MVGVRKHPGADGSGWEGAKQFVSDMRRNPFQSGVVWHLTCHPWQSACHPRGGRDWNVFITFTGVATQPQ